MLLESSSLGVTLEYPKKIFFFCFRLFECFMSAFLDFDFLSFEVLICIFCVFFFEI